MKKTITLFACAVSVLGFVAGPNAAMAQTPSASLTSSAPSYSAGGGTVTLTSTLTYTGQTPSVYAFSVQLPSGWQFASQSLGTGLSASVSPAVGDNLLEWAFSGFPVNQTAWTFTVSYPAGLSGDQAITVPTAQYRSPIANLAVPGITLALALPTAPAITTQPASQTVTAGSAVTFTAAASGQPAPTFQWQKGGVAIAGATNASHTITTTVAGDAGSYTVIATNSVGSVTSTPAVLTVNTATAAPAITAQPANQSATAGASVAFSIGASGTPSPTLQWQASTDGGGTWTNVTDGGVYAGVTSATLSLPTVTVAMNGYRYRCVATNSASSVNSNAATLTVAAQMFAGTYFGTFANNRGHWALRVNADNTAIYIAYLTQRGSAIIAHLTVGADGTFTIIGTETVPLDTGGNVAALSLDRAPGRVGRTVASNFTLSGQISMGTVTGQLTGLGETFSGAIDAAAGSTASGFYTASALNTTSGATYAIVSPSGQALVVTATSTSIDGATGTVGGNGQFSATTASGGQLALTLNASTHSVAATLTPVGSTTPISFSGLAEGVVSTTRLVNIATRAYATTGNGVTIGGFVISGNAPKHLLLRAVGPTLTTQGIGVPEVLQDPTIEVHDALHGNAVIATNDNWGDNVNSADIVSTGARVGATPLASTDTKSAALLLTLQPGVYSFIANGKAGSSGIVLVEVYDAD